jgi:hypothetical protein
VRKPQQNRAFREPPDWAVETRSGDPRFGQVAIIPGLMEAESFGFGE